MSVMFLSSGPAATCDAAHGWRRRLAQQHFCWPVPGSAGLALFI